MWRPKDWEDIKFQACMQLTKGGGECADIYEIFEAGADAMLEALKNENSLRCSLGSIDSHQGGSTTEPLAFIIHAQSIVEDLDGATHISLPNFKAPEYPKRKGWLVFIEEE